MERPERVVIRAQDRDGEWFELEGEGLTARAICHELDHLEGVMFDDLADHIMSDEELEEYYTKERGNENSRAPVRGRKKN